MPVGRNQACPCGSGRQYKRCCGALGKADPVAIRSHVDSALSEAARLRATGDPVAALAMLEAARHVQPYSLALLGGVAELLVALGRADDAVELLEGISPRLAADPSMICALGAALSAAGRHVRAAEVLAEAARLRPGEASVWNNLAVSLRRSGRTREACAAYGRAAELDDAAASLRFGLARSLFAMGRTEDALSAYAGGLARDPHDDGAFSELLCTMLYCDSVPPRQSFAAHTRFADSFETVHRGQWRQHANPREPDRRLRLGLMSSDLRRHSVAHFVEPLLAHHDPSRLEIVVYANHDRADAVTERLQCHVWAWRPVWRRDDEEVAQLVRDDAIDVLVDLNGHTKGHRLMVFARRPAPLQLTWLGYPSTTGLSAIDFRLTDARADPPGLTESWHSETLWRLPECFVCYQPPADAPELSIAPDAGAPLRFGSFNNHAKISGAVVDAWSRLLATVPGSMLVLKLQGFEDASIRDHLIDRFRDAGVDPARLTLLSRTADAREHLLRYEQLDIALDTFPYAGTTTTCDALWMGVPVVTLAGAAHAARVGCSLLGAVGLDDLVARDVDDYVRIAAALAADSGRRRELHASLRRRVASSVLVDGASFARRFESAVRMMWRDWCAGRRRTCPAAASVAP